MATPRASSSQGQVQARDAKRVWSGAGRGRAGLGPVARSPQPLAPRGKAPAPAAASGVAWDFDNANFYRVNYAGDSLAANSSSALSPSSVTNLSDVAFLTSPPPTITLSGLYLLKTSIAWSGGTDGEVVTVTIAGRTLQPVFFEAAAGFVDRWAVPVQLSQGLSLSMANPSNSSTISWGSFFVDVVRILAV